jgi:cold shock protein
MPSGRVKFFNVEKGFGFIAPDDGSADMFVHITALDDAGLNTLDRDQRISFEIGTNTRNGKPKAINLRLL